MYVRDIDANLVSMISLRFQLKFMNTLVSPLLSSTLQGNMKIEISGPDPDENICDDLYKFIHTQFVISFCWQVKINWFYKTKIIWSFGKVRSSCQSWHFYIAKIDCFLELVFWKSVNFFCIRLLQSFSLFFPIAENYSCSYTIVFHLVILRSSKILFKLQNMEVSQRGICFLGNGV